MTKILITDDSATARMFVRQCLSIAGFSDATFSEASNGKIALDMLRKDPADLVMIDLNMPVMNGKQLLRWIKASPKLHDTPVIVISSLVNEAVSGELSKMGAGAVLSKPVTPPALMRALDEMGLSEEM